jgi:hypothetical protein
LSKKLREPWEFETPICREVGGDLFYSADEDDPEQIDTNFTNVHLAKRLCANCVHIDDCAEWGIHHETFGVWGGLSPKELSNIRSQKRIPLRTITNFKLL